MLSRKFMRDGSSSTSSGIARRPSYRLSPPNPVQSIVESRFERLPVGEQKRHPYILKTSNFVLDWYWNTQLMKLPTLVHHLGFGHTHFATECLHMLDWVRPIKTFHLKEQSNHSCQDLGSVKHPFQKASTWCTSPKCEMKLKVCLGR